MGDDGPEERTDDGGRAEQDERRFGDERPHGSECSSAVAKPCAERRQTGADQDLVRDQESGADRDVRPHDAAQARGQHREGCHLHDDSGRDDPGIACLAAREVIADEHVGDREEPDRERKRAEHPAAFREVGAEGGGDQADSRGGIEEDERAAEDSGCEQ